MLSIKILKRLACLSLITGLVACSETETVQTHSPINVRPHDRCIVCGMVLVHYEGPKGQIFIKDAGDEPAMFCSGRDAFAFALQPENARRLRGFYLNDMTHTKWEAPEPGTWVAAQDAVYVYGHRREGTMGPEPVAFSDEKAAQAFIQKWGGKLYRYEDITLQLLDTDGTEG